MLATLDRYFLAITGLDILIVTALVLLAIVVVAKIKEFAETRARRHVASPYGMIRAPSNKRLRRTRDEHPQAEKEEENASEKSD